LRNPEFPETLVKRYLAGHADARRHRWRRRGDGQRTDRQDSEKVQYSQGIPPVCVSLTVSSPRIGAFVVEALSPSVYDYI